MPQFGASLTDDDRVIIYHLNMFILPAIGASLMIVIEALAMAKAKTHL